MRIFFVLLFLFVFWNADLSAHINPYVQTSSYENVYVRSGDTVWHIAAKYTDDSEDIRDLVLAIIKINKLNNNAQVYPGQTLKVPQKTQRSVAVK
ncbi:MAG: LysM peptidoglycan-binding domain-containing protein [Veillonellaceae bacterium]|jgi:LysM repeat protein|nr:LysM peptidoglycan-binding domain-containing protein [Veillonellaceae bacterium]